MKRPALLTALLLAVASALLLLHARAFDFVCDDAFITLRYARNFATHGAPVYNLGEHVEGYTDPLWMALLAGAMKLGLGPVAAVRVLGGASAVGLLAATLALLRRVEPRGRVGEACVLLALAACAPVAAWTLGGLETPLFAALLTWGAALGADAATDASPRRAAGAGLVLALATLTRPEGVLAFGAVAAVTLATRPRAQVRGAFAALAGGYAALVVPFEAWRRWYYGAWLPNTFYVKTSGDRLAVLQRGGNYLAFAALELGPWLVLLLLAALALRARPAAPGEPTESADRRRAALRVARVLVPVFALYVLSVGGDFLDLYRFFVPILPLVFALLFAAGYRLAERPRARRWIAPALVALLAAHVAQQAWIGARARQVAEPQRAFFGIEPLGWTRYYALEWAGTGRWLAAHARPGDSTVIGAAGAMPFYSGLDNLDPFGLTDAYVARHGDVIGTRPGHQRWVPLEYLAARDATFMLLDGGREQGWEARGYVLVDALVASERYHGPRSHVVRMLVRRDRADQLRGSPDFAPVSEEPEAR